MKYLGFAGGLSLGLLIAAVANGGMDIFLIVLAPGIALSAAVVWIHRRRVAHSTVQ